MATAHRSWHRLAESAAVKNCASKPPSERRGDNGHWRGRCGEVVLEPPGLASGTLDGLHQCRNMSLTGYSPVVLRCQEVSTSRAYPDTYGHTPLQARAIITAQYTGFCVKPCVKRNGQNPAMRAPIHLDIFFVPHCCQSHVLPARGADCAAPGPPMTLEYLYSSLSGRRAGGPRTSSS